MVAQEDSALHGFASNLDILSPLTPPTDQEVKSRNDMAIHKKDKPISHRWVILTSTA